MKFFFLFQGLQTPIMAKKAIIVKKSDWIQCKQAKWEKPSAQVEPTKCPSAKQEINCSSVQQEIIPMDSMEESKPSDSPLSVTTLMPQWTQPPKVESSSKSKASPMLGYRVGLSRNFKRAKPLHTNIKLPW